MVGKLRALHVTMNAGRVVNHEQVNPMILIFAPEKAGSYLRRRAIRCWQKDREKRRPTWQSQQPARSYRIRGVHCHKFRTSSAILLWMSKRSTKAWLGRINVLLAWAASAREQSEAAKRLSDQRRGILSGATDIWRNKRQEWLSRRRSDLS
jgi:hypothetical protein